MRRWASYITALIVTGLLSARAEVGAWKNFTSMRDVKDVTWSGSTLWAATSGGLFGWDPESQAERLFTNAEGLQSVDLTAIATDQDGTVWSGTSTGVIHVLDPDNGTWLYIQDIAATNQTNKQINRIVVYGDTVFICTEFGLSIFRRRLSEFGDTFTKFGTLPTNVRIRVLDAAVYDGKLWAAVSDGQGNDRIAVADLSNPNLLPPESWTLQTVGSPPATPTGFRPFNGRLYAGTTTGLFVLEGAGWVALPTLSGANVVSTVASPSLLALCTGAGEVFTVDPQLQVAQIGPPVPFVPTSIALSASDQVLVGTLDGGVLTYQTSWQSHIPAGPASNQFVSVTVDQDGVVWGASGRNPNGKGFYRYDGKEWISFNRGNSPLPTDDYYRVSTGCDGSVWASSYGRGVVEILRGSTRIDTQRVFGANVGMVGVPNDQSFIVTSTVACDGRGNTWMSIVNPADKNLLAVRSASGTWTLLPAIIGNAKLSFLMDEPVDRCLAVDAFDNLWATVRESPYKGVISLGNRGSIDSTVAINISSTNGLPSDEITTIVADRTNELWVGTDKGIGIILDPSNPLRDGGIATYHPLTGVVINTIAVDALNQKWVGTTEGAVLLSPDGTQLLAYYTVENTAGKLIDNNVKSIAFDLGTGTVYFGTASGLASLTTASPAPQASFGKLILSPNPFVLPNVGQLTVDGLVENTILKILSIDGRLMREVKTPGGRIGFWDGKDMNGQDVSSGVYIIAAFSEDGSQVATGKVAVIRR
jgi:ligand-binding sensor domain-containing protein